MRTADRQFEVLELRRLGATYEAIGAELGVSMQRAWKIAQDAFAERLQTISESAEYAIAFEVMRLDAMLFSLRAKLQRGNCRAIETALRIADRRSKLLGLDAATKTEVTGPHGGPIAIDDARERLLEALSRIGASTNPEPDQASSGNAST